jgi:hypothetical protein
VSRRLVVIYEARADFELATELADRVLVESVEWLEEQLDANREWIGVDQDGRALTWASIAKLAREHGVRVHGHFNGAPGKPDAHAARRAIVYLLQSVRCIDAMLLIRDQDDQPARRQGLEQARNHHSAHVRVVIGLANPERECWVLSGFEPGDEPERAKIASEKQGLGFDPCVDSHELTACKNDQAKRSAKRVLAALTDGGQERQRRCWIKTPLSTLEARGGRNGLAAYLKEVRETLVPLVTR